MGRHRIAVERDNLEDVTGQGEAADFAGARIEHMKQHAVALLDADRLAVTEHFAVDAEQVVADFVSFLELVVGLLADVLEPFDRVAAEKIQSIAMTHLVPRNISRVAKRKY